MKIFRRRRYTLRKVTVFILLFLLLVGCSQGNVQLNTDLENSIYSKVEETNQSKISINPLIDFDWEKAFLFPPYSTQESIEHQLGTDFNEQTNIDIRDDIYLFVFLNQDKVIQYAEIERRGYNFSLGEKMYLTPSDDVLTIEKD